MAEERKTKSAPKRRRRRPEDHATKRRNHRPLGLGEMAQKDFPFVAIVNGEAMVVDRDGPRVTFTPWV